MVTFSAIQSLIAILVFGGALLSAYFGWQRSVDRKFVAMDKSVDTKFVGLDRSLDTKFSSLALQINTILEGDIREIRGRISALEADQNEWIKALRERVHILSNDMNAILIRVDRLEHREHSKGDTP